MGKSNISSKGGRPVKVAYDTSSSSRYTSLMNVEEKKILFENMKVCLKKEVAIAAVSIFFGTLVIFTKTAPPSLVGGDSGELIVAAHEFGVAHPPGYPLFTLLAQLSMSLIPLGSVAWRVNIMCATCGAACSAVMFLIAHRLTASYAAGVFASGMFSFSRLVWTWSVCAEVFSLNNLLISLLLYTAVIFETSHKKSLLKTCIIGALLCGLCLSNQHTTILYIIIIIPWVFYQCWEHGELTPSHVVLSACSFCIGLLPYMYLPVSAYVNKARWTWGDQTSVGGFLTHLLRQEYGTLDLLKDHTGQGMIFGLQAYMAHAWTDLSPVTCFAMVAAGFSVYFRLQQGYPVRFVIACYLMLIIYLGFFCWRANLDINNQLFFRVVERFWLQSDMLVCLLASVFLGDVLTVVYRYVRSNVDTFATAAVFVTVSLQLTRWWSVCDQSNNVAIRDFAHKTLDSFPTGSIILTKGDLPSNSLRYFHLCENLHPDLSVFDQEVLTYKWSLPMTRQFFPNLTFPGDIWQPYSGKTKDGVVAFTFKDLINANYDKHPIFACIGVQDHEASWQQTYTLWPWGVCWKLVQKSEVLDVDGWHSLTQQFGTDWTHGIEGMDEGTWEQVASAEMWRARVATAYFFLDLALMQPHDSKEAGALLLKSHNIYSAQLDKQQYSPSYWHRNFAIVCEHLSRHSQLLTMDSRLSKKNLLTKTVFHFKKYLVLEPNDPDFIKIQSAIDTLEKYLNSTEL